jgi:hypothetical protein
MLRELNTIATGLLGLHGYLLPPLAPRATSATAADGATSRLTRAVIAHAIAKQAASPKALARARAFLLCLAKP